MGAGSHFAPTRRRLNPDLPVAVNPQAVIRPLGVKVGLPIEDSDVQNRKITATLFLCSWLRSGTGAVRFPGSAGGAAALISRCGASQSAESHRAASTF